MASDNEASCESDPNFAVICAFMEKFGTTCGLQSIDFLELQDMLENTQEVPQELIDLHIKLLRKSRKSVSNERWEKAIIKFCHTFCVQDAWEIERFGYKKARLSSKLRVLKELLEMQFDYNTRFKAEINKMSAEELRSQPLGKDKHGHAYWFQNDNNCQIRVYKEDPDEETWTLIAKDRDGLAALITELSDRDSKISTESAINEEDSNSLVEKPIIDTGQVDSSSDSNKKMSGDSENSNESKESTKKENISPQEDAQTDEEEESEESKEEEKHEINNKKRERESDEESPVDAKKSKIEAENGVSEAIEEPVMVVKGEGNGEENECINPIVGEEIEEAPMFFYGEGNGVDCQTGNEDKTETSQSESGKSDRDASDSGLVSISDSKNCVNDEVPTSPVKSPYKLGTIIDTKTDNKFFSTVKNPTKKSRWDVETIIAKDPPETGRVKELVNKWEQINEEKEESPPKKMFFFGPGCLQFGSPATVGFGQKVPPEKNDDLEAKGDVGYRIGEEGDNKRETSDCVQSGPAPGPLDNEVVHETPIESRLDKLENEVESDKVDAAKVEQTKVDDVSRSEGPTANSEPNSETSHEEEILPPPANEEENKVQTALEKELKESEEQDEVDNCHNIPQVTAALIEYDEKPEKEAEIKEDKPKVETPTPTEDISEPVPVVEEICVKKHAYTLGEETEEPPKTEVVENHESENKDLNSILQEKPDITVDDAKVEEKDENQEIISKNDVAKTEEKHEKHDVISKNDDAKIEEKDAVDTDENENKQVIPAEDPERKVAAEEAEKEVRDIEPNNSEKSVETGSVEDREEVREKVTEPKDLRLKQFEVQTEERVSEVKQDIVENDETVAEKDETLVVKGVENKSESNLIEENVTESNLNNEETKPESPKAVVDDEGISKAEDKTEEIISLPQVSGSEKVIVEDTVEEKKVSSQVTNEENFDEPFEDLTEKEEKVTTETEESLSAQIETKSDLNADENNEKEFSQKETVEASVDKADFKSKEVDLPTKVTEAMVMSSELQNEVIKDSKTDSALGPEEECIEVKKAPTSGLEKETSKDEVKEASDLHLKNENIEELKTAPTSGPEKETLKEEVKETSDLESKKEDVKEPKVATISVPEKETLKDEVKVTSNVDSKTEVLEELKVALTSGSEKEAPKSEVKETSVLYPKKEDIEEPKMALASGPEKETPQDEVKETSDLDPKKENIELKTVPTSGPEKETSKAEVEETLDLQSKIEEDTDKLKTAPTSGLEKETLEEVKETSDLELKKEDVEEPKVALISVPEKETLKDEIKESSDVDPKAEALEEPTKPSDLDPKKETPKEEVKKSSDLDPKKETIQEEAKKAPDKPKQPVVILKNEDKIVTEASAKKEEPKEPAPNATGKRGRKNNSSEQAGDDEKKPRMFTRRTTRSSKSDESEEKLIEIPPPTRRGRPRANQKANKEENSEGDSSKKMKMTEETKESQPEVKPEVKRSLRSRQKEEAKEEKSPPATESTPKEVAPESEKSPQNEEQKEAKIESKPASEEASPASVQSINAAEPAMVESSSSNDIAELPDHDPLAVSEEETKEKKKPMSLSTFSLDFNESPTPTPPLTRSGLRKRGRESPQNEETGETGGKRQKMKAKRAVDTKLRKSIEEQKKKELISSDDDSKTEQVEKNERKKSKKTDESKNEDSLVVSSDAEKESEPKKKKKEWKNKNKRLLTNLGLDPEKPFNFEDQQPSGVRQSRRIAQLKIKEEAERRKMEEDITHEVKKKKKSKKSEDKDYKAERKKIKNEDEDEAAEEDSTDSKKRKKKKKKHKKLFDELNPWRSSSDSSSSEEEEMGEEEEEEDEDVLQYVSDHEFSPESDMEGDGEALPLKRARTARKESDVEEVDDCPCQKCGKSDHPEWILLCDSCDNGWHCSCLRPPLLVIPEGDWFCPPCQHASLLKQLQEKLKDYDNVLNKKKIEDRRKERLAYVGISLNNVLPAKDGEHAKKHRQKNSEDEDDDDEHVDGDESSEEESESGSATGSESGSDSDEPIYQLRQRRQAHSYRFNDYDELINSAIQDEMEAVKGAGNQGRGKDIATIVNAEKEEERKKEAEMEQQMVEPEPLPPVVPVNDKDKEARPMFEDDDGIQRKKKIIGRKKHRKLNALDISSEEDEDSDEDFKGTSSESDDDFDEDLGSEDSDDLDTGRRRKGNDPVRRSTRARTSRYDADFIDDGDSDSEDQAPRRKKKRSFWDESESEESDRSWGRRKRKPASRSKKPTTSSKKKSKKKKKQHDSDEEVYKKKKPKIKFGLDGDDDGPVRRTRGKKINYVDALGSDSDEDRVKRPPPRIESDEEYVANEDDVAEDEKISEEEAESGEEGGVPKEQKIQIQSYTDARFTQLLPEPKPLLQEDGDSELNPIDQINRNVEMMDENEMEKMMEEEEYANKQLQMVAQQLEKEKRRKEREAKKLEGVLHQTPMQQLQQKLKKKKEFQFSGSMQEPLVGNVDNLLLNSENNDELSEPPGVSLPLFAELGAGDGMEDPAKKRRGRSKKSLEETVANLGSARHHDAPPPFMSMGNKVVPTDLSVPQESNIEIAAPPQPFSQSQPTPSVITRMLQSKPGQPGYPVGTIRPKQFAAMPEREEDIHHSMASSPVPHGQYIQGTAGMRPQIPSPYRPLPASMNHYPRNAPPPQIRNPVPHMYHSHRPLDPSPSGGGISEHNSPGRVVSPAASSPGSNKNETPPPPYSRPGPLPPGRFPMVSAANTAPRHVQLVPPPHLQPPRPNLSPYHPGMPPQYHYGQFGQEDALPPTVYQNSPYQEHFEGAVNQSENSNSKSFEEESGGEFGGLVSYFSSQREDDLES